MNRRHVLAAGVAIGAPALPFSSAWAQTVEVSGVKFDTSIQLGGGTLKLNGYGVRHRFLFEVYAAGLYLGSAASTVEAVLAAPGAKRMQMVMLRKLDATDFGKILTSGILGEQYVGLEAGGDGVMLKNGDRVRLTQSAVVLENLISQFLFNKAAEGKPEEKR